MADASYWDHRALEPAPTAHRLQLGERSALFCARTQQLYELNPTADAIWLAIADRQTPAAAAEALDGADTLGFVRQAAMAWMQGGQLVPTDVLAEAPTTAELHFRLDELHRTIRICGEADPRAVRDVFGQFDAGGAAEAITVVGQGSLIFMLEDRQPLGAWDERTWIPALKARLTELYVAGAHEGFLAHAALLARGETGLLLCAEPGGGKSTLAVALAGNGFEYHADDIVRFDAKGHATGAPFSPAAKSGAWPLLGGRTEGLLTYLRGDGQEVRYLPLTPGERRPLPIGAVLLLDRQVSGEARIEPVEPMEVLTTILGSAYSSRRAVEAETLSALAATVNRAKAGRLVYSNLDSAVRAVGAFVG